MHETGLIRNLVRTVEHVAQDNQASRVVGVRVWLGALCPISPEHFREHFEQDTAGTLAAGARLELERSEDLQDPHAQDVLLKSVELGR